MTQQSKMEIMSKDYQALDEELDKEIMALYGQTSESETESDSPAETGTESQEEKEVETESQEQDLSSDSTLPSDDTQQDDTKETVDAERYHNAVKAMNKAQQEAAELRKQIAGANQQDALIQQLQTQIQELQSKAKAEPEQSSTPETVDDDELKEAKEIYPEVVNPLLKIISNLEAKLSQKLTGIESEVGSVKGVADRYQQTEAETADQKYWSAIEAKHSDVREVVNTPEYAEWYHQQAPMIQKALSEGTAQDAISALDLFRLSHPKEDAKQDVKQETTTNKPDKLAAAKEAAIPNIRGQQKPTETKPKFTQAQIAKMSREEFMKHEAEIDEALARGEID
jgi:hypothetical protein